MLGEPADGVAHRRRSAPPPAKLDLAPRAATEEEAGVIGHRLKVARAAAGLSLRALEARVRGRVTAPAISKYERDQSVPGSGVLIALAEALHVSVDHLTGDPDFTLETVEFRKKALTSWREEARVEAQVVHLLERYLTVETLLRLAGRGWDRPREAPYPIREVQDAE